VNLLNVIDELVEERDLDRTTLINVVIEGMLAAYKKKYPHLELRISFEANSGNLSVDILKDVVTSVEDEECQISLRKARGADSKIALGQKIWVPFDGSIGRVEILKARQIIAQKIGAIEARVIFDAFKSKEGTVVQGSVYKSERGGTVIKIQDAYAFLPQSLSIAGEKLVPGYPVKVLLKEVLLEPRNENQLILDRASVDFLKRLFELEIPEVFERLVDIRKIVRDPGYKSKVMVSSHDANIDPVGTCVGVGGVRIKPILKELGGEKIDIITADASQEELVKSSLKPAEINRVEVMNGVARVWLDDEQRSLAIGKMGKNIALASALLGLTIELVENIDPNKKELLSDVGENNE